MLELWRWKALKWEQCKEIYATGTERTGNEFSNRTVSIQKNFSSQLSLTVTLAIHYVGRERYIHGISASQTKYEIQ